MIQLVEADYAPFETFALRNRLVHSGDQDVFPDVRARVRPLASQKAAELAALAGTVCGEGSPLAVSFRTDDPPAIVTDRLRALPPDEGSRIVVSWNPATAIATDWRLFTARWELLCYPAADDVTVMPVAGGWNLCYRRYDVFQFRSHPQAG